MHQSYPDFIRRTRTLLPLLAGLGTAVATAGIAVFFKGTADVDRIRMETTTLEAEAKQARQVALEAQAISRMQEQIDTLKRALASTRGTTSQAPPLAELNPADRHAVEEVKTAQSQLDSRMGALENALTSDPVKALSLPLMRKDLDALQDRTKSDLDSIRGELGRLYTLTQWFIGLMFTIALGVFSLALANLRRGDGGKKGID